MKRNGSRGTSRRLFLRVAAGAAVVGNAGCLGALEDGDTPEGFTVERIVEGLTHPWGLAFVTPSHLLVTERAGTLRLVYLEEGVTRAVIQTPPVVPEGQGGLLDVTVSPDYPSPAWVYLTYASANLSGETATTVGRGRLTLGDEGPIDPETEAVGNRPRLEDWEPIHVAEPFVDSRAHYGSRVIFGPEDALYVTTGDRGFKNFGSDHVSQDRTNELGATLRLDPDGSIPEDNPFVAEPDVADALYTYGHRNAQGMTVHPETGDIWQSEHGERDGDELNVIERGGNYGWPVTHTGCEYGTDNPVGDHPTDRDDVVNPVHYWECTSGGFPPAGMTFYEGEAVPAWDGDLFVGNLAGQDLGHFAVDGREVTEKDPLLAGRGWRIRDVTVGPDESLYVAIDDEDAPLVRLAPE